MPSRRLDFSAHAGQDLDHLLEYTVSHWGTEQASRYRDDLIRSIERLCDFPELGRSRKEIRAGLRCLSIAHHVVLYRVLTERILIERVIHERADVRAAIISSDALDE